MSLEPGSPFPDLDLPDHTGRPRQLSDIAGGDPLVLVSSRGWWCPKEQRYMRRLTELQEELEVAYARLVVVRDNVAFTVTYNASPAPSFARSRDLDEYATVTSGAERVTRSLLAQI